MEYNKVCMTIGMQRVKAASGSIMRQSGVAYAFAYQAIPCPAKPLPRHLRQGRGHFNIRVAASLLEASG